MPRWFRDGGRQRRDERGHHGQRLPFLVISPFARTNYVASSTADQTSILAFIENNWLGQARVNANSFDNLAGSVTDMFNFASPNDTPVLLNPNTGEVMHG